MSSPHSISPMSPAMPFLNDNTSLNSSPFFDNADGIRREIEGDRWVLLYVIDPKKIMDNGRILDSILPQMPDELIKNMYKIVGYNNIRFVEKILELYKKYQEEFTHWVKECDNQLKQTTQEF